MHALFSMHTGEQMKKFNVLFGGRRKYLAIRHGGAVRCAPTNSNRARGCVLSRQPFRKFSRLTTRLPALPNGSSTLPQLNRYNLEREKQKIKKKVFRHCSYFSKIVTRLNLKQPIPPHKNIESETPLPTWGSKYPWAHSGGH